MKKFILIAVVVLAILAVGGIGGMALLGKGPFAKSAAPAADASGGEVAVAENHDRAYDLGTYIIPIISDHTIRRQIGMDLAVVVDPTAADRVSGDLPRLQNALLLDLYDFVPRHADAHSPEDREAIRQRLVKVANVVFGDGAIHDVVIKSLYDR